NSTLSWSGTLYNTGRTWNVDSTTGPVNFGGSVDGGTISASPGALLLSGSLRSASLAGSATISNVSAYDSLKLDQAAVTFTFLNFFSSVSNDPALRSISGNGTFTFAPPVGSS